MAKIRVDESGFIWNGHFRLPMKYDVQRRVLMFFDKDKLRSEQRGSTQIEIPISRLALDLVAISNDEELRNKS
jgi:hypothetical protein